jgi:DNA-binding CsgD family transcriptional regulator
MAEWTALDAMADGGAAVGAFDEAAGRWTGHHALRALVCAWGAADAARRTADGSATDRLRAALAAAERHGFEPLAARVRRSLRLAGVRVTHPVARSPGRGLLTARERDVLALVAAGQSNIEIARRMGLGRPTVARHLSSAMAKLGAESRAQAVTLAQEP